MKILAYFFLSHFIYLSTFATLTDNAVWPIAPYNMFSFHLSVRNPVLELVLKRADGTECRARPANALPFEFFRANAIIKTHLFEPKFRESLLKAIAHAHWTPFDEVHPPSPCLISNYLSISADVVTP